LLEGGGLERKKRRRRRKMVRWLRDWGSCQTAEEFLGAPTMN
jgi:hypothetical protein